MSRKKGETPMLDSELAYYAKFESLHKDAHGNENKKIWAAHMDMEKQWRKQMSGIQRTSNFASGEIRMQQMEMLRRREKLLKERDHIEKETQRRHRANSEPVASSNSNDNPEANPDSSKVFPQPKALKQKPSAQKSKALHNKRTTGDKTDKVNND